MRETTLSICEKNFILNAASELKRLDGRKLDEFRNVNVHFGTEWGLCYASLGETRVIAQVSCEVQQPKTTRPNEGLLYLNVEVSSMAAPHIEPGRSSDVSNHLNRLLEKCIKDSKAVDLESLCLVAEEKVWALRVDVNILNHDGNLEQAASISAIAALAHFRRPDVTTNGEEIVIHDITERDPIPITLHHFPICITYALLNNGENVLADPTSMEERVSDASLIFGINAYGEICGLHLGGNALVGPKLIVKFGKRAAMKAREIVEVIKRALENDSKARQSKEYSGLVEYIHWDKIKSTTDSRLKIQLSRFKPSVLDKKQKDECSAEEGNNHAPQVIDLGEYCAELVPAAGDSSLGHIIEQDDEIVEVEPSNIVVKEKSAVLESLVQDAAANDGNYGDGGESKWEIDTIMKKAAAEESDSEKSDEEVKIIDPPPKHVENIELSGDSEEEVMVLEAQDIENPAITSKNKKGNTKSKAITNKAANASRERKNSKKRRKKF